MLDCPQSPVHGPVQGGVHVGLGHVQQVLLVLLLLGAAGPAPGTTGRNCAEENTEQSKEDPTSNQTWSDQLELQGLETLVTDTNKGDDKTDTDHAQTNVEDDVSTSAFKLVSRIPAGNRSSFAFFASSLWNLRRKQLSETNSLM